MLRMNIPAMCCALVLVGAGVLGWYSSVPVKAKSAAPVIVAARTGSITANPDPIQVCDGSGLGIATLSWQSTGTVNVQVRIGAPNGALFAYTGSSDSSTTGKWLGHGTKVFLQDVSGGLPLTAENTLATLTIKLTTAGCTNHVGSITANPNPIQVCDGSGFGAAALSWQSTGTVNVQVRIGAPDGALFAYTGSNGSGTTGKWLGNGSQIFLQDVSGGLPLTAANTLAQITVGVSAAGCGIARLDPANRTGGEGEDPLSQNFNWSVPLVNLPGRSGFDLGLSLSYNSLVWTKSGSAISFDDDRGFPSPGFRLGFPVIQAGYFNAEVGRNAFLLITPNGERVELRQVGTSALYESADSYHMLLDTASMTLRTTDGTELKFTWNGTDYQCTRIKDRNGNYITITYTPSGRIDTVIDTLARTIKFNYDAGYLSSITQTWGAGAQAAPHYWARFTYADKPFQTNFRNLTVVSPPNNSLHLLTQVKFADDSHYDFDYTTWGQVWQISNYADASFNHRLNYRSYNLPQDKSTGQDDCPRFTERRDWAENWNRGGSLGAAKLPAGPEREVITRYSISPNETWAVPNAASQTGTRTEVIVADGTAEQTTQRIYFEGKAGTPNGWRRGLASLVETFDSSNALQKQSVTTWTQDNTAVSYPLNPRVTETNVHDYPTGARRRTTIEYGNYVQYGLPYLVREFGSDAATEIRRTYTDYNLSQPYLDAHIIGLVSAVHISDGSQWQSKVTYAYDDPTLEALPGTATQHLKSYEPTSFTPRGNLTAVSRWDVNDLVNVKKALTSKIGYNTAGSVVRSIDASDHSTGISYSNAGDEKVVGGSTTFAYPTSVTDADNNSSSFRYDYDFGAITWKQTPSPNAAAPGPEQTITYDSFGRVQQVTNLVNGAHTRFGYSEHTRVDTYTTIRDTQTEAHSFQITDGHGRVIATASSHRETTGGGLSGQLFLYDVIGRVIKTSNPTETYASGPPIEWGAVGDDAYNPQTDQGGWRYSAQTYDWKGRPLVTTNTDGTTKTASYSGCGCAGGQVVTLTDEVGRRQKIYDDVLGRTAKTEVLNWLGSAYLTTANTFNARDQVTSVHQYDEMGAYQDTSMSYDGYGRLQTRHVPQQDPGRVTTWEYNPDDTVRKITDARDASKEFSYNNRHLVTKISYEVPNGSNIPRPGLVSFGYDAAGNRTSMTDDFGSMSYNYDQLSRLNSETRIITNVGVYPLSYAYNLAGALTAITNPFGAQVSYEYDAAGRVKSVGGGNFANVSTYASNLQYRAWGALKSLDYGNSRSLSLTYNSRLQPASYTVPGVMSKTYDYRADGRRSFSHDLINPKFDRSYNYDHVGRITEAFSGAEARNEGTTDQRPYKETFNYDALGHLTGRPVYRVWSKLGGAFSPAQQTYQNERNTVWHYDADGNLTDSGYVQYTIDAGGESTRIVSLTYNPYYGQPNQHTRSINTDSTRSYDGDGNPLKVMAAETVHDDDDTQVDQTITTTSYQLRSSVLDKVVMEVSPETGRRGFVYLGAEVLAWQLPDSEAVPTVNWEHRDPGNASFRLTPIGAGLKGEGELDPLGTDAETIDSSPNPSVRKSFKYPGFGSYTMNSDSQCTVDGFLRPCEVALALANGHAAKVESVSGSVPNFMPVRVVDPDTPDPDKTPEDPDNPDNPVTVRIPPEHYHYELVYTGDVTTSTQRRELQKLDNEQQSYELKKILDRLYQECLNKAWNTFMTEGKQITGGTWSYVKGTWSVAMPRWRDVVGVGFSSLLKGAFSPIGFVTGPTLRAADRHKETAVKLLQAESRYQNRRELCNVKDFSFPAWDEYRSKH
jgi:YD repeat-containing protein